MTLQNRINDDYMAAFKQHETTAVDAYRMLKTAVKNAEIEARHELSDEETLAVVAKEAKRRRESIAMFTSGGRQDLATHEQAQLAVIEKYLPAQMSDDEISTIVTTVIADLNATPKEFGKVMSAAMAKIAGRADGTRVSAAVKARLK